MIKQYIEFENLIKEIFKFQGFQITDENKIYKADKFRSELDFSAKIDNKIFAVEVKFYRQSFQNTSLLRQAANQLISIMKIAQLEHGLLVISSNIKVDHIKEIEDMGILVISRADLFDMASKSTELTDKLTSMLEDNTNILLPSNTLYRIKQTINSPAHIISNNQIKKNLCDELKKIDGGKTGWTKYEEKCTEILKYLFSLDLTGWQRQQRTDDGLNRFDLITRIRSVSDFWKFMTSELQSRYIIFEFKNYKQKINQGQVLTTEKYLHLKALRSVAFIISRKGPSDNAIKFTQGAMREHGKLIITLTDEDLCKMIQLKDNGDDPNDYMFELVDSFLMSLPR